MKLDDFVAGGTNPSFHITLLWATALTKKTRHLRPKWNPLKVSASVFSGNPQQPVWCSNSCWHCCDVDVSRCRERSLPTVYTGSISGEVLTCRRASLYGEEDWGAESVQGRPPVAWLMPTNILHYSSSSFLFHICKNFEKTNVSHVFVWLNWSDKKRKKEDRF